MEEKKDFKEKFGEFHDKHYKKLLFVPLAIIIFFAFYMFSFYSSNGDFITKDFSLTGGTSITIQGSISPQDLENSLSGKLEELDTRVIYDLQTRQQSALIVQTKTPTDEAKKILEDYLGYNLDNDNSSIEFISSALGENFYSQLLLAVMFAFIFMGIVVFIIFRNFIPSMAVIISALADIFMTLAMINILGIKMSSAGIVAFLMLIGYSVDTDILLTNKVLKRHEDTLNTRIFGALKTGITMTTTSLLAVVFALIVANSFSVILTQIFTVLTIGLCFDILNTWITNVSLIKWYVKKNEN
ncbi:hypothetical protein COU59_01945 [Candidatus Pacearchaeota archaeon CG10_big_fil_rev_8_21_14_0_10_34_12]|nr:MAG: hypothetical protein COU59_01945 [Candidatus Pacearchaeota archaeon CG10_big_fil_rev_8_21_14_0_10_34_12]